MPLSRIQTTSNQVVPNLGRRNLIINGAMQVSQRATSTTGLGASSGYYSCDRFRYGQNSRDQAVFTLAQVSDAPSGFSKSFKITTTTPESAIEAADLFWIEQQLEGQNITHLNNGSSDAKPVTLSFYVKSSITGTFGLTLYKPENTVRVINSTYTINSANTWELKTVTFAGDTSGGGINNDNTEGMRVAWHLGSGSDYDSVNSTSWANYTSTNWAGGHAQDGVVTTSNATWQLTGVQLEVGSTATDFEHRSFAEELQLCQRYYFKSMESAPADNIPNSDDTSGNGYMGFAMYSNSSGRTPYFYFPVEMRADPTITIYSSERANTSGKFAVFTGSWGATSTSTPAVDNKRVGFSVTTAGGTSSGNSYLMAGGFDANAEL